MIETFILNFIYLLFPLTLQTIYDMYANIYHKKISNLLSVFLFITAFYFLMRFCSREFIGYPIILITLPLLHAYINKNRAELVKDISGKSILVIGGAGSIGSSFVKAVLPFEPKTMVVVDVNENALTELTRDLRSTKGMYVPEDYVTYPMDFSSVVFEKMFRYRKGFDIVANFSAHKHVRSEKDIYSVEALLRNNVLNWI